MPTQYKTIEVYPEKSVAIWKIRNGMYKELVLLFTALRVNVKSEPLWAKIHNIFDTGLQRIAEASYREGCKEVYVEPSTSDVLIVKRKARERAAWLVKEIKDWTYKSLDVNAAFEVFDIQAASKKKILGKKRAKKIIDNETYVSFYNSRDSAWKKNKEVRKEWVLGAEHGNIEDICDENAEEGAIEVDEPFGSGDFYPPAHIGCYCRVFLRVPQNLGSLPGFKPEHLKVI